MTRFISIVTAVSVAALVSACAAKSGEATEEAAAAPAEEAAAPAEELAESLVNSLGWQSPPSLRDICR